MALYVLLVFFCPSMFCLVTSRVSHQLDKKDKKEVEEDKKKVIVEISSY